MSLVTKEAPNFTAQTVFPDNSIKELNLSDYRGKYVVLFFYPLDFTFVCPSEIISFDGALAEFKERGAEVIGVSVDSQYSHFAWKNTPRKEGGIGNVQYPLVADLKGSCATRWSTTCLWVATSTRRCACWTRCSSRRSMARSARPTGGPVRTR